MNEPLFSLIVPTYNEAENIVPFLTAVHLMIESIPHEVIVVDDDSPDLTWDIASHYAEQHPWVKAIRRRNIRGLSSAVLEGFAAAHGEILGVMDADLSHDEHQLPILILKVQEGADLAVGSRRVPGGGATRWPWYRRFTSTVATRLATWFLGLPLSDPMSGFFVMKRSVYEGCRTRLYPTGYKILLELVSQSGPLKIAEVPFVFRDRRQGHSKLGFVVMAQYVTMIFRLTYQRVFWRH